ncbi:MAG: PIN domain-containing protein [Deltaproteobacteria bacterium]|jgi:predicted nucleic acid-binding protein|nr:MAG: PIN domain-containing protein [Deltaproteobacteria bacterium]
MPVERIENLPAGTRLFLDANIFVYAFLGHSNECQGLLGRCATEQVLGITTLDVVNEVTHRMMLAEGVGKGVIKRERVRDLRGKWREVAKLTEYWTQTSAIFGLNILVLTTDEARLHVAQTIRVRHGLLTNDSLIVAAMEEFGIDSLATRDNDFDHISELIVYKPSDI